MDARVREAGPRVNDAALACCRHCPSERRACLPRPARAPVALVLDAPSEAEARADEWFRSKRGGAGELLRASLEALDVDPDELYVCSALNCRPNMKKQAMLKNAMLSCRKRLVGELREAGVEKVLCVGAIGYSALVSADRLQAITKVRGRWKQAFGMNVLATLPPGFIINEPDYFRDFAFDLRKFFSEDGPLPNPTVELWTPETLSEAEEAFAFLEAQPFVSIDLETTGFSPVSCDIIAAGFGTVDGRDGVTVVLDEDILYKRKAWRLIQRLINSEVETVFHNAKFDLQFIKEQLTTRGLRYAPTSIHDSMMLNYTLDERPMGKFSCHNLEGLARVRYDAPDYGIDMGKFLQQWEVADAYDRRQMRKRLHVYLALDCYYTARLFPDLWNEALLEDEEFHQEHPDSNGLLDLYENLLMPGTLALADIEHHGILMNPAHYEKSRTSLDKQAAVYLRRIRKHIGKENFNPGSPKQVQEYIYDELGMPRDLRDENGNVFHMARRGALAEGSTAAHILKALSYRFPQHKAIIDDIVEYRNLTKNIGTYVDGLLRRIDIDDRIHGNFNLHGTATGRLSSSDPNLQNIPDASHTGIEIRGGFVAPPGCRLIEADYKQLEVRIAAELSGDKKMLELFESGRDIHAEIGESIYHKPREEISHYMRWLGKNILFGLLYGRGHESVAMGPEQEDIVSKGGRRWTIDEVGEFYGNLLNEWQRYAEWQREQKSNAYRTGEVRLPSGRVRRFAFIPKHDDGYIGRAGFNTPIQGTASDFTLYALIRLHALLPEGAHIVSTIHDSLLIECREEIVDEVCNLITDTMEGDTLYETTVPLKVDIDVSPVWGLKDNKLAHVPIVQTKNA